MITETIFRQHAERYPLMQPSDAVKLLYQAVFGGGHLIKDEASCRHYLVSEYASVRQAEVPLYEIISPSAGTDGAIVRVYLAALDAHRISPDELADAFIQSSASVFGTREDFDNGLHLLRAVTHAGLFTFDSDELDVYLHSYLSLPSLPPVSHSDMYRNAYAPHYRVIRASYLPFR